LDERVSSRVVKEEEIIGMDATRERILIGGGAVV
jgi:hypothetical protein